MDLFLAICQGLGLALAAGVGGLLSVLLMSVLAHVGAGWDLDGGDFDWFASQWFIPVLFALNVGAYLLERSAIPRERVSRALLPAVTLLGAAAFAASLAEETSTWWPGLIAGAAAAAAAALVAESVLAGARRRSEETAGTLTLLAASAGAALAAASVFFPPVSLLAAVGLAILAAGRRRRSGEKYEGLRSLR